MTKSQSNALADLIRYRRYDGLSDEEIAKQVEALKRHQKENKKGSDPASPEVLATLAAFRKQDKPKIDAIEYFTNYTKNK